MVEKDQYLNKISKTVTPSQSKCRSKRLFAENRSSEMTFIVSFVSNEKEKLNKKVL